MMLSPLSSAEQLGATTASTVRPASKSSAVTILILSVSLAAILGSCLSMQGFLAL